jgi:hypothetical protein
MPETGLEPALPCGNQALDLLHQRFRHNKKMLKFDVGGRF